jgi:hypothetical protein
MEHNPVVVMRVESTRPVPKSGAIYLDSRGAERALRVTWHHETDLVVLSLWRGSTCAGSFRLPIEEVPDLIEQLRAGLTSAYDAVPDDTRRLA